MGKPPAALVLCFEPLALRVQSCTVPKVVQHIGEEPGSDSGLAFADIRLKKPQAKVESLWTGTGAPKGKWDQIKATSGKFSNFQWAQLSVGWVWVGWELSWLRLVILEPKMCFTAITEHLVPNKCGHAAWKCLMNWYINLGSMTHFHP